MVKSLKRTLVANPAARRRGGLVLVVSSTVVLYVVAIPWGFINWFIIRYKLFL